MPKIFNSECTKIGKIELPEPAGVRIMMMPIIIGDSSSIPDNYKQYKEVVDRLGKLYPRHVREVGYLTVDEKVVQPAKTHRREGLHVDGIYQGSCGVWAGSRTGGWGAPGSGMLTVSSHFGCRAWNQPFEGNPGPDGECDHLANQLNPSYEVRFEAGEVWWVDGLCVHESIPQPTEVLRQFVRVSMPSCAPWFEGYTENPLGILPTGPILPRRIYMDA